MNAIKTVGVGALMLLIAGCTADSGPKQQVGTILGAIGGAVAGAQFGKGKGRLAATAAGTLVGAFLGNEFGKSLDRADQVAMNQTMQRSLEDSPAGTTSKWNNPSSGHAGTITPRPTYQTRRGTYCREFQQTVTVGGRTEEAYGTACRQPDGSWQVVSN